MADHATSTSAICGAPCPYGGRWAARKWSKAELGAWNHCNRRVAHEGDRCWQHRSVATEGPDPRPEGRSPADWLFDE